MSSLVCIYPTHSHFNSSSSILSPVSLRLLHSLLYNRLLNLYPLVVAVIIPDGNSYPCGLFILHTRLSKEV